MTATITDAPARPGKAGSWELLRWGIAAGWLVVVILFPLVSERTSSWHELEGLVESGTVTEVRASPELPADAYGYEAVVLHWERGPWNYVTTVFQMRSDPQGPRLKKPSPGEEHSTATLESSPVAVLKSLQPGLDVQVSGSGEDRRTRVLGFAVPWALSGTAALLGVLAVVTLIGGPQPWRATKWAWFWLFTFPPVQFLFVVLSGPTPGVPAPKDPGRRLTGGWAFLLTLVAGGVSIHVGLG